MTAPRPEPPSDVINGVDPSFDYAVVVTQVYRCTCGTQTLMREQMTQHLLMGHPAHRNPALTCHEAPMWDHERWCLRPKNHDGDHWTPSFGGGQWWPPFVRCPVVSKARQCIQRKGHARRHEYASAPAREDQLPRGEQ